MIRRCRAVTKPGPGGVRNWAGDIIAILREAHQAVEAARAGGDTALDQLILDAAVRVRGQVRGGAQARRRGLGPRQPPGPGHPQDGHDVVIWKTRTARLLSNYLEGRQGGPVFVTDRGAKADAFVGPADRADRDDRGRARLSYERAEALFRDWAAAILGKAATLHQLRHSALTHDAEDGASAPMLMTKSGHASIRTLSKYARPGTEALAKWQEQTDRTRRGRD